MPARGIAAAALLAGAVAIAPAASPVFAQSPPSAQELARAQALVRANALDLAQEILEARAPKLRRAAEWLAWERQLWVVYRIRGQWRELYARAAPALKRRARWPPAVRREARLQAVKALVELRRGADARRLIRDALADADAPPAQHRQARRELVASYLADGAGAATEAQRALREFQAQYGTGADPGRRDLQLLTAAVSLRGGDADAAINQLAPLDSAAARLLKLYARLANGSLAPAEVSDGARALLDAVPAAPALARPARALIAQAQRQAGARYPLADALETVLLTPPSPPPSPSPVSPSIFDSAGVAAQFTVNDLLDAYARIARHQAARAGLPAGDPRAWLAHARALPPALQVARRALFAHLAAATGNAAGGRAAEIHAAAVDGYVDEIVNVGRLGLLPQLFGGDKPLGALSLGGRAGLRLAAAAIAAGDFRLAAAANAALRDFPPDVERGAWLLRAGRVDLFAGEHARGAARLDEYLESFAALDARQTDAVLQVIFDLQTLGRHGLALPLLRKVDARAPRGKHQREIAFWRAESYAGDGKQRRAAALFLHSALQAEDSFDRWGRAARFRAALALTDAGLFGDARRQLQDLLAGAGSDERRRQLRQQLQRVQLLEAGASPAQ
ncbi:MAG: hypothetical protein OXU98_00780 [Gammaproteobacteria bacterium]|nr:hypothetical protein [Gammaproteobacteria bacterium]